MATHWSSQNVVAEHKSVPATAMSVDNSGTMALLAGRRFLGLVKLDEPNKIVRESTRGQSATNKFDVKVVEWNPTSELNNYIALAAGNDCEVYSVGEGGRLATESLLQAHVRGISDINWHRSDAHLLATASVESYLYLWDIREPRRPMSTLPATSGASQVKWNRQNSHLLASGHETDMRIWDSRKPDHPLLFLPAHASKVNSIDWSPHNASHIVSSAQDSTVRFFNILNARHPVSFIRSEHPVWRAKYTPFGHGVVTIVVPLLRGGDNSLLLWAADEPSAPVHCFMGHTDVVTNFDWRHSEAQGANEDCQLVSWGRDRCLRVWRLDQNMQSLCGQSVDFGVSSDEGTSLDGGSSMTGAEMSDEATHPHSTVASHSTVNPLNPGIQDSFITSQSSPLVAATASLDLLMSSHDANPGPDGGICTASSSIKTEPLISQFLEPRITGGLDDEGVVVCGASFGSTSTLVSGGSCRTSVTGGGGRSSMVQTPTPLSSSVPQESGFGLATTSVTSSSVVALLDKKMSLSDELAVLRNTAWKNEAIHDIEVMAEEEMEEEGGGKGEQKFDVRDTCVKIEEEEHEDDRITGRVGKMPPSSLGLCGAGGQRTSLTAARQASWRLSSPAKRSSPPKRRKRRPAVPVMSPASSAVASILASPATAHHLPYTSHHLNSSASDDDVLAFATAPSLLGDSPTKDSIYGTTASIKSLSGTVNIINSHFNSGSNNISDTGQRCQIVGSDGRVITGRGVPDAASGELIFIPEDLDSITASQEEELQNCVKFITYGDVEDGATSQILVQGDGLTFQALDDGGVVDAEACKEGRLLSAGATDAEVAAGGGTQVMVGQDGTVYALDARHMQREEAAESVLDSDVIFKGTPFEIEQAPKVRVEITREEYLDENQFVAEKFVVKINTLDNEFPSFRTNDDDSSKKGFEPRDCESYFRLHGITLSGTIDEEDPNIPKKKTVHVDEHCLDFGGSVFYPNETMDNDASSQKEFMPEVEVDKSLKKILIPLGNSGYMRVFGRTASVDKKIIDKYPVPTGDLCRDLALPLLKNLVMEVGQNIIIFGVKIFMVTVDFQMVEGKELIHVGVSEPEQHVSLMRELGYNFVEIVGWEPLELTIEKRRTRNIMLKNEMNLHQCSSCKKSYKTSASLATHMLKCRNRERLGHGNRGGPSDEESNDDDDESRIYSCSRCDQLCYSMSVLNQHMLQVHPEMLQEKLQIGVSPDDGVTSCFMCQAVMPNAEALPMHLIEKHAVKMMKDDGFKCLTCECLRANAAQMIKHKDELECEDVKPAHSVITSTIDKHTKRLARSTSNSVAEKTTKKYVKKISDEVHRCGVCASLFGSRKQIQQHLITHTNLRPFKCDVCAETFTFRRTMIRHCNETHPEVSTQFCNLCGLAFETVSELKKHMCDRNKGDFPCPYCDWETNMDIRLFRHIDKEHHEVQDKYYCRYCANSFHSINKLRYHQKCSHPDELKRQAKSKADYKRFEKQLGKSEVGDPLKNEDVRVERENGDFVYYVNPMLGQPEEKDRTVNCYYCPITFSSKNAMRRHIQHQHPDRPLYRCTNCDLVFKNNASYCDHHRRFHKRPKVLALPGVLNFSSANSNCSSSSGNDNFNCEEGIISVGERHKDGGDLLRMERQVEFCEKKLAHLDNALQSGNVAFQCPICLNFFITETLMRRHYNQEHPGEDYNVASNTISPLDKEKGFNLVYYKCKSCLIRFDDKKLVVDHLDRSHRITKNVHSMYVEEIIVAPIGGSIRKSKNSISIKSAPPLQKNSISINKQSLSVNKKQGSDHQCTRCFKNFSSEEAFRRHRFSVGNRACNGANKKQSAVTTEAPDDDDDNDIHLQHQLSSDCMDDDDNDLFDEDDDDPWISVGPASASDGLPGAKECLVTINAPADNRRPGDGLGPIPHFGESIVCKEDPDGALLGSNETGFRQIKVEREDLPTEIVMGDDDEGDGIVDLHGPPVEDIKKEIELNEEGGVVSNVTRLGDLGCVTAIVSPSKTLAVIANDSPRAASDPHVESEESFMNVDELEEYQSYEELSQEVIVGKPLHNPSAERQKLVDKKKGKLVVDFKGLIPERIREKVKLKRLSTKPFRRKNESLQFQTANIPVAAPAQPKGEFQNDSPDVLKECSSLSLNSPPSEDTCSGSLISVTNPSSLSSSAPAAVVASQSRKRKADENVISPPRKCPPQKKKTIKLDSRSCRNSNNNSSSKTSRKNDQSPPPKTKRKGFHCEKCNDKFVTKAELAMHTRYDH